MRRFWFSFVLCSPLWSSQALADPYATVKAFFQALSEKSAGAVKAHVSEGFLLLERGEIWSVDKLVDAVRGDYQRRNFFSLVTVSEVENTAWVAYWNRAFIEHADGRQRDIYWLESAVLERVACGWKIKMLHSTRSEPSSIPAEVEFVEYRGESR